MESIINEVNESLDKIAMQAVMLEDDDIPAIGEMLNSLTPLKSHAGDLENPAFTKVIEGLNDYLERMVLSEEEDVQPVEDAIAELQQISRAVEGNAEYTLNDEIIMKLNPGSIFSQEQKDETPAETPAVREKTEPTELSEEDMEILGDFIIEAQENLESIELNLLDLEQSPEDNEIINAIFRPFHTIKGVSGFLDLFTVNRLSHSTENLLDSARQGNFIINNQITDIILESVDALKALIQGVEQGLEKGMTAAEGMDVDPLIKRIDETLAMASKGMPLGEMLVQDGSIEQEDLDETLKIQKENPEKKIGEILVEEKKVESKEVISALRTQKAGKKTVSAQVKVDTLKLDNLVDMTGELVISQSMLRQHTQAQAASDKKLFQNLNQLTQIVSTIQNTAMGMRMVPIKTTFQKMVRLVRDLSKNLKKEVALEMSGEDTEIDRNVVEALYEPMVHMIRNSVDHGMEIPADREAAGKNRKGIVHLRAYHKGGNMVIDIEDDGKGLDSMQLLEKAIDKGLISESDDLSDSEIFDLIMQPGFSTAKEITDVSGRGVGMDVVKKAIEALRGRIDINSTLGKGTLVTISLPLTLAIIEGMLVRVGEQKYVIPTMAILESFRPSKKDCHTVEQKGEMVMARGKLIPLVRIDRVFGVKGDTENPWEGLVVVVENKDEQKALLLDELLGKEEFVIKNLGDSLKGIKGLAGGAILGDGRVGLILDMAGLFEVALLH